MRRTRNLALAARLVGLVAVAAVAVPLQAVAAVVVSPASAAVSLGSISILDAQVPMSGIMNSATIGTDGLPIIAYRVTVVDRWNLRVAHCQDLACTAITTSDIDTGAYTGLWTSIKIGSDGLPLISYLARENAARDYIDDLKVAHCNDIACTSATVTTLDAPARVELPTSLTIGADGLGLISYEDSPQCCSDAYTTKVKVAHCLNIACTSAALTTVDTIPSRAGSMFDPYGYARIATGGNGFGIISYYESGSVNRLKVAACTNPDCTTKVITIVDATPFAGRFPSLTVGLDGFALISYAAPGGLWVAHCSNLLCTQSTRTVVDSNTSPAQTSITIGGDGLGVISYWDNHTLDLKVAHCANVACSTATNKTVDAFDDVGAYNSTTIGTDGLPLIAYSGPGITGLRTLRMLHCGNADCTAPISKPF